MASRSDQLHSHQFARQRAVAALAMRDPDPAAAPLRRIGASLFTGLMLAVLAVAAVGVYGLLRPGGGSWRDGRATIIEQETGARFVFLHGTLHPVLNHTSAMLVLGTSATVRVGRADLLGVPRGAAIGIPGAPDPLPGRDQLVDGPWTLCSRPPNESVLRIGWEPSSAPLRDEGVLAVDPAGGSHLLWHGRRYALRDPDVVLAAFTWAAASATPVPAAVLNAIPAGGDLAPVSTPRADRGSAVPGLRIGEVFVVTNPDGNRLYGVALANGVSTVTAVQAAILVADGANGGRAARDLSPAAYAEARKLEPLTPTGDDAPPANTPTQARPAQQGGLCATFADGAALPELTIIDSLPSIPGELAAIEQTGGGATRVDRIAVPPGHAVVVESLASAGSPAGALAVVSDLGLRFAVPSRQVLEMLGYAEVPALRLPAALVSLVPAGSALDPALAALPAM